MNDLEREYTLAAIDSLAPHLCLLPAEVQRKVKLAESILASHGTATGEEIREDLGPNWVLARRGRRIVEKYGKDVNCVTPGQYDCAQRRAIERRFPA
jgi:hypothetical protein